MTGLATHNARLVAAVAIVAVIVLAAPVADLLGLAGIGRTSANGDSGNVHTTLRADEALSASDVDGVLENLERIVLQNEAEAPEWFRAEVGLLPGARDVRVVGSGRVVGYVVDCDVEKALACLEEDMQALGWKAVPLGQIGGFTFVRQAGSCTWALVTCTQVGSATSVVVRTA